MKLPPPRPSWRNSGYKDSRSAAFTLPEILIAVSIFAVVVTLASSLYIQSFRETHRANLQNQIYEDTRYIMTRIADEVRNGMIDYDEYYNQNVVIPYAGAPGSSTPFGLDNFGQNYGRYYSSFFHPGNDLALGFDCNDGGDRNRRECTPLRRTIDRNTGANPFSGKFTGAAGENENAFCGNVSYGNPTGARLTSQGWCDAPSGEPLPSAALRQSELYLISPDGFEKTILAREEIAAGQFALAMLKLQGIDTNRDSLADHFVCADKFQCRGSDDVPDVQEGDHEIPETGDCAFGGILVAELPRSRSNELEWNATETCDTETVGFSKDFVPISPFHVNVSGINFFISPAENPHYAFSEGAEAQQQPAVTIVLTVTHPEISQPITLVQTVFSLVLSPTPAPLLVL